VINLLLLCAVTPIRGEQLVGDLPSKRFLLSQLVELLTPRMLYCAHQSKAR